MSDDTPRIQKAMDRGDVVSHEDLRFETTLIFTAMSSGWLEGCKVTYTADPAVFVTEEHFAHFEPLRGQRILPISNCFFLREGAGIVSLSVDQTGAQLGAGNSD